MHRQCCSAACCSAVLTSLALAGAGMIVPVNPAATPASAQISAEFQEALAPYGHWERHPRWGKVWIPDDTPPDWRPYTYGHWVYTDEWGWYWISDPEEEDWGWVTYHYGRWVHDRAGMVLDSGRRMGPRLGRLALWRRLCRLGAAAA